MPRRKNEKQNAFLKRLGFAVFYDMVDNQSLTSRFAGIDTCGLYCLKFDNNVHYIGKSTNIPERLIQHQQTFGDIREYSYKNIPPILLGTKEVSAIQEAERNQIRLLNIEHTSATAKKTEIYARIASERQEEWILRKDGSSDTALPYDRPTYPAELDTMHQKFNRLKKHKKYAQIIQLASTYLQKCIPFPYETEKVFWSISCLPNTTTIDFQRLFCFNIFRMETFVLFQAYHLKNSFYALLNLSRTALLEYYTTIHAVNKAFRYCIFFNSNYKTAGYDQISLEIASMDTLKSLLQSPGIIYAAKVLNLRLMRKGTNIYSKYHCMQLANAILTSSSGT